MHVCRSCSDGSEGGAQMEHPPPTWKKKRVIAPPSQIVNCLYYLLPRNIHFLYQPHLVYKWVDRGWVVGGGQGEGDEADHIVGTRPIDYR